MEFLASVCLCVCMRVIHLTVLWFSGECSRLSICVFVDFTLLKVELLNATVSSILFANFQKLIG